MKPVESFHLQGKRFPDGSQVKPQFVKAPGRYDHRPAACIVPFLPPSRITENDKLASTFNYGLRIAAGAGFKPGRARRDYDAMRATDSREGLLFSRSQPALALVRLAPHPVATIPISHGFAGRLPDLLDNAMQMRLAMTNAITCQ